MGEGVYFAGGHLSVKNLSQKRLTKQTQEKQVSHGTKYKVHNMMEISAKKPAGIFRTRSEKTMIYDFIDFWDKTMVPWEHP